MLGRFIPLVALVALVLLSVWLQVMAFWMRLVLRAAQSFVALVALRLDEFRRVHEFLVRGKLLVSALLA